MLPALAVGFLQDDFVALDYVQQAGFGMVTDQLWPGGGEFFRPLGFVVLWLEYLAFGLTAPLWHATHLALFVLAAILTARLAARIVGSWVAPWACALALAYPGRLETSVWLVAVFDLLALLLVLTTLLVADRWWRVGERPAAVLVGVTTFLACLAKEVAFAAPLLLVALMFGTRSRQAGRLSTWLPIASSVLGALAAGVYRTLALGGLGGYQGTGLEMAVDKLPHLPAILLTTIFVPVNPLVGGWSAVAEYACMIGAAIALLLISTRRDSESVPSKQLAIVGAAFLVLGLIPALPYLPSTVVYFQSRYLSVAAIGVVMMIAAAAGPGRWRRGVVAAIVVSWCGTLLVNIQPWLEAARYRDIILEATEKTTQEPGTHVVWYQGAIHDVNGAHVLGGHLQHALRVTFPDRTIKVDSVFLQRYQGRPAVPPEAHQDEHFHVLRVEPDRTTVTVELSRLAGPPETGDGR